MGERSITTISIGGETANYNLAWGSPQYQVPMHGKWVVDMAEQGRELTIESWEAWAADEDHDVAVERVGYDAESAGALHMYILSVTANGEFSYCYRHRPVGRPEWLTMLECDTVAQLLAAGVEWAEKLHRTAIRRNASTPMVRAFGDDVEAARIREAAFAAMYGDTIPPILPELDTLPEPRAEHSEAEHLAERVRYCEQAAAEGMQLARASVGSASHQEIYARSRGLLLISLRARGRLLDLTA
ncbi:hypothetical protein [Nocardia africana]|uniref:Uncharacterized protein n=2 Tax=Nocardia africana TaxID=134964 RepID=A0A379X5L5_9NOCA|nr:hypothetical protein [Nocardia africana]MCC3318470.1 hypothetical protein [Nocardia africana]SUH71979.1 Uncharacterised protein [Nocardia africana]